MSLGPVDADSTFRFAFDNTVKKPLRWVGLSIVFWIPIINFIAMGIFLKVYRGEEPDFTNAGKSFIQGLLLFIILIIYVLIPPLIILNLLSAVFSASESISAITLVGIFISILIIILGFIMIPATINFARKQSFGAAFALGQIFSMIGKLGIVHFISAWILYEVIVFAFTLAVGLIVGLVSAIPVVGAVIILLYGSFIGLFSAKYFNTLFE
ncbi:MAG: DUF4013 domain-containing protein [Methanocorpusculum sp.]|nr:DUF4013 domain-containing protein [Methanocorpusculum sp.]